MSTTKARITSFDSNTGNGFVQTSIGVVPFTCVTVADLGIGELVPVILHDLDGGCFAEIDVASL